LFCRAFLSKVTINELTGSTKTEQKRFVSTFQQQQLETVEDEGRELNFPETIEDEGQQGRTEKRPLENVTIELVEISDDEANDDDDNNVRNEEEEEGREGEEVTIIDERGIVIKTVRKDGKTTMAFSGEQEKQSSQKH